MYYSGKASSQPSMLKHISAHSPYTDRMAHPPRSLTGRAVEAICGEYPDVSEPEAGLDWKETEPKAALAHVQFNCGIRRASRAAFLPGWCKNDIVQTLHTDSCRKVKTQAAFSSWKTVSARCGPQSQDGPASWGSRGVLGIKGHRLQCLLGSSFPGNQPSPYPALQ